MSVTESEVSSNTPAGSQSFIPREKERESGVMEHENGSNTDCRKPMTTELGLDDGRGQT